MNPKRAASSEIASGEHISYERSCLDPSFTQAIIFLFPGFSAPAVATIILTTGPGLVLLLNSAALSAATGAGREQREKL